MGNIVSYSPCRILMDIYESESYFKVPLDSKLVGIFLLTKVKERKIISIDDIRSKLMIIPTRDGKFVAIKLLHSE